MLESRGIEFEEIGFAQGVSRAFGNLEAEASRRILAGNLIIEQQAAHVAGRESQLQALLDALREVDPANPVLQDTGLVWPSGQPALAYETVYSDAYDTVASARGIQRCTRPMTPADQGASEVLSEPVRETRFLWVRRWHFRGDEYRSRQGAERARQRAADMARRKVA